MGFQPFLDARVLAEHAAEELLHHPHPPPKKTRPWVYWALGLGAPWQTSKMRPEGCYKVCLLFVKVVRSVYPTLRNGLTHFNTPVAENTTSKAHAQVQGFSDDYP